MKDARVLLPERVIKLLGLDWQYRNSDLQLVDRLATKEGLTVGSTVAEASERGIPIVLTLGGGYAKPIDLSVDAHLGTWREARAVFG